MLAYRVSAFNTAAASDNKIHDDAVAGKLGFTGGLVPGVDVFAYLCHVPAEAFGRAFLERGWMKARFRVPVYDGDDVTVESASEGEALMLSLRARDTLCAEGSAGLSEPSPAPSILPFAPPPSYPSAPVASEETLQPGRVLGTLVEYYMGEGGRPHLAAVRERLPLFEGGRIAHPAYLLRRANFVLSYNVRLGPWIHTESDIRLHSVLQDGEPFETRAVIIENIERKGHLVVVLDFTISSGARLVMSGRHWAIWKPRQLRG